MDQGKIFERLLRLANSKGVIVRFCPFQASEGRLHGNRLGIAQDLTIDKINYNLAHELAHAYLHYDKGDTIHSEHYADYEEQADRAACMLLGWLPFRKVKRMKRNEGQNRRQACR